MPEIFHNLMPQVKAKSWWDKRGFLIMIVALLCLLALVIYLLYREYYQPAYSLTDLLPKNYSVAVAINNDAQNLPKILTEELLRNEAIKNVYQKTAASIDAYSEKLPLSVSNLLKKPGERLIFLVDQETFGLIIKLKNENEVEAINNSAFSGLFHQVIKKQILVISNKQETLDQILSQPFAPLSPFNFSLSLTPWLTIYFQETFFNQAYDSQLLADLKAILLPLKTAGSSTEALSPRPDGPRPEGLREAKGGQKNYRLELLNAPHQLILELAPEKPVEADAKITELDNYLRFLPASSSLILGLSEPGKLTAELSDNENLNHYFKQADLWLWLKVQTSLSQLIKELKGPVIVAASGPKWQITTEASNRTITDYYLRRYLAQFTPIKKPVILPDGTKAIELIADPGTITWETSSNKDWQTFSYPLPQTDDKIGYAIKENLLIISNKINKLPDATYKNSCDLANKSAIFSISPPNLDWLSLHSFLKNFAKITAISSTFGHIKICLEYE